MAGQDKWYFSREQLLNSPSKKCGLDADKELAYRQQAANLIQDMGQRLHVSQLCINTAIVYMHRFYAFHSFTHFHRNAMAAAALFLAAKMEEQPRKLEYVIKIAHLCLHRDCQHSLDVRSDYYQEQAQDLVFNENVLLQTLGFDVAIDHPHTHVVKTCSLIRASKDLAQTSYFMASNSLHLTTMCLQYKPTVVACFCIHLASKWSNWEIPQSNEGKHWFNYVDKSVTAELLEHLTSEFLHIFDRYPSRLKKKIMSMPSSQGSPSQLSGATHSGPSMPSPFDKEPRKIPQEEIDKVELSKHQQGLFGPPPTSTSTTSSITKIDHREYRDRQRRAQAAAAAASSAGNTGSGSNNNIPATGPPMQRPPPHRWPHPPRDPNASRDGNTSRDMVNLKERDSSGGLHPNVRDAIVPRENSRDSITPSSREQSNIRDANARESISSRDHNGIRETSGIRENSRETSTVRDASGLRDLTNQRDRDSINQRDHSSQRDSVNQRELSNYNAMSADNMRLNSDVRSVSANLRDTSMNSANVRDSNSGTKEPLGRDSREHSNSSGVAKEPLTNITRDTIGQSRSMSGHNRESSSSRGHNGSTTNIPQPRSSHPRHLPPSQGIPPDTKPRSSQQSNTSRPPLAVPTPQQHSVPPQRPPSLFSPPEPQRKPIKPPSQPLQAPLLSIPREALVPAPLSPFSSPNDPEPPKPVPEMIEDVVKKEEIIISSIPHPSIPQPAIETEVSNNLETDPTLISSLLKESIPHRSEKKKKKEKHKHKDKKEKREKHKKKDKKRDSEQHSSSHASNNSIHQPIVSNSSNNLSIKITLPREAAANVIPVNPVMTDRSPPPTRLTIKIPKERIKIDPSTPHIQMSSTQQATTQALKIKIPKELVERENRKRPVMGQGASREGPPSKASRSQSNASHHPSTKVSSHHTMGNGQSNYHK